MGNMTSQKPRNLLITSIAVNVFDAGVVQCFNYKGGRLRIRERFRGRSSQKFQGQASAEFQGGGFRECLGTGFMVKVQEEVSGECVSGVIKGRFHTDVLGSLEFL